MGRVTIMEFAQIQSLNFSYILEAVFGQTVIADSRLVMMKSDWPVASCKSLAAGQVLPLT